MLFTFSMNQDLSLKGELIQMRFLIAGITGKMGRAFFNYIEGKHTVEAGIVRNIYNRNIDVPLISSFDDFRGQVDIVVDYTNPSNLETVVDYCSKTKTPLLECTTGIDEAGYGLLRSLSEEGPVMASSNMSIFICLCVEMLKKIPFYSNIISDISIIEMHHKEKRDCPSGTALLLENTIKKEVRDDIDVNINSVRGGTIYGTHEIILHGDYESLSLKHKCDSREVFAHGTELAAEFLVTKEKGMYNMNDLFDNSL